jgi:hypothetical protein
MKSLRLRRPSRHLPALLFALAAGPVGSASAAPSPADVATAQAAYDSGKQLLSEGKYAEACPKLEESQRLDPGTGTQFHLADCWEHIGRTASAWAAFLEVATASKAAGRTDRETISRARAAELEPRLSRVTIVVAAKDTPGLQIQRDGETVGSALWETPIPVDLGSHIVAATAPGKQRWEGKVELTAEGATKTVTVPALADEAPAPKPQDQPVTTGFGTTPVPGEEPGPSFWSQRNIGLIVGGAGVVAMAVALPLALAAKSKFNDARTQCQGGCTDAGASTNQSALSLGNAATVFLVAGGVVTAAGGVLWLTAPRSGPPKQARTRSLRVGVTPTGVVLDGAFQ